MVHSFNGMLDEATLYLAMEAFLRYSEKGRP